MLDRLRLLPIVILCATLLLGLKVADMATGGTSARSFAAITVARAEAPAARPTAATRSDEPVPAGPEDSTGGTEAAEAGGPAGSVDPRLSKAEMSVLESLAARREELKKRAEALDMREQVTAAAEKRVEDRIAELRALDEKINVRIAEIDAAHEEKMMGLVSMYEGMKPKDAARIFERLDMGVLLDVVKRMQPRRMSAVLAAMDPVVAQDLTVELATGDRLIETPPLVDQLKPATPEAALAVDKNAS